MELIRKELTRKEIEDSANVTDGVYHYDLVRRLAKQLLVEMDQPKVWDGAPEWAVKATVSYFRSNGRGDEETDIRFTRTLPKSPEREIAEKYADKWDIHCDSIEQKRVADAIEAAINEYKESVK